MKPPVDPILLADQAEEEAAAEALRLTTTKDELVSAWWLACEHFDGAARERLQEEYAVKLREFVPMGLAG
jgi:hypothetical protein